MKIKLRFIKSKIGRRIFFMFTLSALLPMAVLGGIAYFQVSRQLAKQSDDRLKKEVKAHGLAIYERLNLMEAELIRIGLEQIRGSENDRVVTGFVTEEKNAIKFKSLSLFKNSGEILPIQGAGGLPKRNLSPQEKAHLQNSGTVLWVTGQPRDISRMFMARALVHDVPFDYLMAEIDTAYLWEEETGNSASPMTDILVIGPNGEHLFRSREYPAPFLIQLKNEMAGASWGALDVNLDQESHVLVYRMVFTQPKFLLEGFTVVLCQPRSFILAPMGIFKQTFFGVTTASFLTVILLSIVYIRKSLVPLDVLKEGMIRVTQKKFNAGVVLTSGDEFEELAENFNSMARQLDKQFKTLRTRSEIDRSILSSMNLSGIIETTIKGMQEIFERDLIAISLINQAEKHMATSYVAEMDNPEIYQAMVSYMPWDIEILKKNRQYVLFDQNDHLPRFLNVFSRSENQRFLVLPIFFKENPVAAIILSRQTRNAYQEENIVRARQVADQVAVALSNAQLLDELNSVSWGTLVAFGRAVDAKSPWTAGHSERVSRMAVKIGGEMGLDDRRLDTLERAGILHDIGKIGIPAFILDKPGKLSFDEMETIKKHPVIGARILEPIKVFSPLIPMILQHHEQYNGKGYPNGISGEDIDFGARILAVADVFDALTSNRPYRNAMRLEKAIEIMRDESGKMFDPLVLKTFLSIVASKMDLLEAQTERTEKQAQFGT